MKPLTKRQINIIKAVVQEYTETAEPVGSGTIDKKYNLEVSPATIRNEMVRLEDSGYLNQPHTSAGRIPTPLSLKLYVTELMKEEELPVAEEVEVKERVWDVRHEINKLLSEATRVLSEKTGNLGVAVTHKGRIYSSGYSRILAQPEFFNIDVTRTVLSIIESHQRMNKLFDRSATQDTLHLLLGEELGNENLQPCALAYIDFEAGPHKGHLGVVGPARLNYPRVVPILRHFNKLLEEVATTWT